MKAKLIEKVASARKVDSGFVDYLVWRLYFWCRENGSALGYMACCEQCKNTQCAEIATKCVCVCVCVGLVYLACGLLNSYLTPTAEQPQNSGDERNYGALVHG